MTLQPSLVLMNATRIVVLERIALAIGLATLAAPIAAQAQCPPPPDPPAATDAATAFMREADAVRCLRLLALEHQIADEQKAIGEAEHPQASKPVETAKSDTPPAAPQPPSVDEIAGSDDHLFAVFRFQDGHRSTFRTGDNVPGFGRITSISLDGVRDALGRVHPVGTGGG